MKYNVEETKTGRIGIQLHGLDLLFIVETGPHLTVFIDEKDADGIAFQLQAILQDRERKKDLTNKK